MGGGVHGSREGVFEQNVRVGCRCYKRETAMAETDFKYDVFISYSHKDEGWV